MFVRVLEIDRICSEIAGLSWWLAYGCVGETGSPGIVRARGTVAWESLAFGKQIGKRLVRLSASWRQALWCALLAVGAVALILAAVWIAFVYYNLLFDPLYAALVVVLIYLSQSLLMFLSTEAERERIRGAFGMYLSPALVEQLASHPEQLKLGGELRTLSILFCDVRGFTSISELYDPQGLTRLINRFLTPMSQIILDGRGTIDKYMGDCIMAFWNAPLDVPDHAGAACRASLEMYRRLNILNDELKEESEKMGREFRPLHVGVGLNTGLVCVGNMGSEQRFDYSVLGDDVNLASRLEGQSKTYGVDVVISEATRSAAEGFATIEIDLIRVKGKSQPVRIHALLGDAGMRAEPWFAPLEALQLEVLAAYRAQDWSRAATLSAQARAAAGGRLDALYDLYDERIAECAANPPGPEWDGVYEATSK